MSLHEDYKNLLEMNKEMDSQLVTLISLNDESIVNIYGLDLKIKNVLLNYTADDVDNFSDDDILKCLKDSFSGEGENTNIKNMIENHELNDEYRDKPYSEYAKYVFKEIIESNNTIRDMKKKKEEIETELKNFTDDYFSYVNSTEYKDRKLEKIKEMREKAESEEDPYEKKKIQDMLNALEKAEDLSFLMDHINEKGTKEVDNIASIFFDKERSSIVMKKFATRIPKFGYNQNVYKHFFNIEEMFLPDEYNKFNNLFLFHVMRTISFMDPYDKNDNLYASSIFVKIYNLIYHKYPTKEVEDEFIEFIKKFDDMFVEKWSDRFAAYNVTSPDHPERIKKEVEIDQKTRMMLIAQLQNRGVEPDTTMSTVDLRHLLDDVLEKEKKKEEEEESVEKEDYNPDDMTSLTPNEIPPEELEPLEEDEDEHDIPPEIADVLKNDDRFVVFLGSKDYLHDLPMTGNEDGDSWLVLWKESNDPNGEKEELNKPFIWVDDKWVTVDNQESENIEPGIPMIEKEVYVDRFRYYYVKDEDSDTYTYYTREDIICEKDVPELTVLQLVNGGVLTKETRLFKI